MSKKTPSSPDLLHYLAAHAPEMPDWFEYYAKTILIKDKELYPEFPPMENISDNLKNCEEVDLFFFSSPYHGKAKPLYFSEGQIVHRMVKWFGIFPFIRKYRVTKDEADKFNEWSRKYLDYTITLNTFYHLLPFVWRKYFAEKMMFILNDNTMFKSAMEL